MKDYDPLTPEEVNDAAKEFFPLFDIVHRNMPENCTVEDTIKVMETVCSMAQKRRAFDKGEVGPFGFNKKTEEMREAVERLHQTIRELEKKNAKEGGDYGVGK